MSLNEITCIITDTVSKTNKPPIIAKTISCFTIIAMAASDPPRESELVSPIKFLQEEHCTKEILNRIQQLNRKILRAHLYQVYIEFEDNLKIVLPTTYEINVNDKATNITGTVAKPSNPSVKFTAFDAPIITNNPKV